MASGTFFIKSAERENLKVKKITIADMTLTEYSPTLSFKEKIEVVRSLDNLNVDVIYMPRIENVKADSLLIRTVSAFVKNSTLSVEAGNTAESIETAALAISGAKSARMTVRLPVSPVQMEYSYHKKPAKMAALAKELFAMARAKCENVEFYAEDATRADSAFLREMVTAAIDAGIKTVTFCDDEGSMLPDEFAAFIEGLRKDIPELDGVAIGAVCKNTNGMSSASAVMALKAGVSEIKCCVGKNEITGLSEFAKILSDSGDRCGVYSSINYNVLGRTVNQIKWIEGDKKSGASASSELSDSSADIFDIHDSEESVAVAVRKLGYELSDDDFVRVYEEFKRAAAKKNITAKDLDAIVSSVALQVPPTYKLVSYVINSGNIIQSSAQIKLEKKGEFISGISMGDGPIDAAFKTLEQIIGRHFELDDFQIQSVTEGQEAMGYALVKLRNDGKLYSGNGISTDIMEASIKAYINAVNKTVYEEETK